MGFIDCALWINPFGCSPLLKGALGSFDVTRLNKYPDLHYRDLKKDLVSYWGNVAEIKADNLRLGSGSMDILERLNRMFIDRGSRVLGYCPQFTDYMTDVEGCGGIFEYVALRPEKNYRFDGEDLLSKLDDGHRLIYIDNPNNPTGQVIPLPEIRHVVEEAAKKGVCVIVDEAYGDYIRQFRSNGAAEPCGCQVLFQGIWPGRSKGGLYGDGPVDSGLLFQGGDAVYCQYLWTVCGTNCIERPRLSA